MKLNSNGRNKMSKKDDRKKGSNLSEKLLFGLIAIAAVVVM